MKYTIISSGIIGIALARLGAFANQVANSNACGPKPSRSRRERFQMLEKRISPPATSRPTASGLRVFISTTHCFARPPSTTACSRSSPAPSVSSSVCSSHPVGALDELTAEYRRGDAAKMLHGSGERGIARVAGSVSSVESRWVRFIQSGSELQPPW